MSPFFDFFFLIYFVFQIPFVTLQYKVLLIRTET